MNEQDRQCAEFFLYYGIGIIFWALTVFVFRNSYGFVPQEYDDRFMLYALGSVAWPIAFLIASIVFILDGFKPYAKRVFK